MICAACGSKERLEWLNVNTLSESIKSSLFKKLEIRWGEHAVVVICKNCLAEVTLTEGS